MMRLSPLQSRLAASLAASLVLLALYFMLTWPQLAVASEIHLPVGAAPDEELDRLQASYEPDFAAFDRGIIGRAPSGVTALSNNVPASLNLSPGTSACYMFEKSSIFARSNPTANTRQRRDDNDDDDNGEATDDDSSRKDTRPVYLSANTCLQPSSTKGASTKLSPPQLALGVYSSKQGGCPTSTDDVSGGKVQFFEEGAVMLQTNASDSIYVSIIAPNVTDEWDGVYNFYLVASTDEYYYRYDGEDGAELLWMDSDSNSVLLLTKNLTESKNQTERIMNQDPPYQLFVENTNRNLTNGMRRSVCGLERNSQILANSAGDGMLHELVKTRLTTQGPGGLPKQQFYFENLNASSSYTGVLYKSKSASSNTQRDGAAGGGGVLFQPTEFQTSSATNCKVLTDLDFCDEIQYAAPGNSDLSNTELAKKYDDRAKEIWAKFEKVMMQIPCEAPPEDSYSLARNCDQCKAAYKRWLCTVSIPRCEDFTSNSTSAIIRNVAQPYPDGTTKLPQKTLNEWSDKPGHNTSRNSWIDNQIKPGPYREVLPCEDLCYEVVQSCPAAIGFTCPRRGHVGFDLSYGRRDKDNSEVTCNFPGESRTKTGGALALLPRTSSCHLVALAAAIALAA